ncbi:hypothetical protein [Streptomyces hainanensis]|uniref:Uncharacterized protein n=1 Tax=Streptomyces hainanensis TaxID=402648 RepID=A0A4R4TY12_9ACTN|nr:hypothetical protein [Streptomyces hainanensis]TDC80522.1 hypothetical protein E1283_00225 [Streptomyces hainanensis]
MTGVGESGDANGDLSHPISPQSPEEPAVGGSPVHEFSLLGLELVAIGFRVGEISDGDVEEPREGLEVMELRVGRPAGDGLPGIRPEIDTPVSSPICRAAVS